MRTGAYQLSGDLDLRSPLPLVCKSLLVISVAAAGWGQTPSSIYKALGAVVSVESSGFTVQTDAGARVTVTLADNAILLRVAPNQKDLKNATKIAAKDIGVGDRVMVRGHISDDQKTLLAAAAIVMSKADIAQKQAAERAEWQRGVGGLVSAVDPVAGTVAISTAGFGGTKKIAIHATKDTILRRYSPDSVKFDDATPGTFAQIQPGDQLRARGTRSADGNDFAAQEIVSGTFRNIAGTVVSVDAGQNTLTVTDLKTKKPVAVKFTADSQMRKLEPQMAQMMAMRLKGGGQGGPGGPANGGGPGGGTPNANGATGAPPPGGGPPGAPGGGGPGGPGGFGGPGGARAGGPPDFQRMLSRLPQATLADFKKGDAVMIVTTQGTEAGGVTAITLLSGVEPILTASPAASQALFSGSWNLGAPGGGGGEEAQ